MMSPPEMSREIFLKLAETYGLDPADSHMKELYEWVVDSFQSLDQLDELDLSKVRLNPDFFPDWE